MSKRTEDREAQPDPRDNPMGTDGFEFVEYAAPDPAGARLPSSRRWASLRVAQHRSKDVALYRQGDVNFVINAEPGSFGQSFARVHGPSVCAIGFRVRERGARLCTCDRAGRLGRGQSNVGPMELNIPAIKGVGDSLLYLVDRYGEHGTHLRRRLHSRGSARICATPTEGDGIGLATLDHLTHNVHRGRLAEWSEFYERLFGFREIRTFDIEGRAHRVEEPRHDEPMRQDPHPDQRILRRSVADPGIPRRLPRRGHPTHRPERPTTSTPRSKHCAPAASRSSTRRTPTTRRSTNASANTAKISSA